MTKIIRPINHKELAEEYRQMAPALATLFGEKVLCPHVERDNATGELKPSTLRVATGSDGKKRKTYKIAGQEIVLEYFDAHCTLCGDKPKEEGNGKGKIKVNAKDFVITPEDIRNIIEMVTDILPTEYQARLIANAKNELPLVEKYHSHNLTRVMSLVYMNKIRDFWSNPEAVIRSASEVTMEANITNMVPMAEEVKPVEYQTMGNMVGYNTPSATAAKITPNFMGGTVASPMTVPQQVATSTPVQNTQTPINTTSGTVVRGKK